MLGTTRWLEVLGIALWTLAETGSPFVVALMLFARTLPMVLFGVPIGALADRVERRGLLACGVAAGLAGSIALLVATLAGVLEIGWVALGAFVNGTMFSMEHPVRRALIADAVGVERIGVAFALDAATFNSTRMTGPLAGGAIYAAFGLGGVYAFGVVAHAAVLIAVLTLSIRAAPSRGTGAREPFVASLAQGLAHVRASAVLGGVLGVTVLANLFGFPYASMAPVIAERVLGLDAFLVGVLMSMEGFGALVGALTLAFLVRPAMYGRVFVIGAGMFLVMVLVFSRSSSLALSMAALFAAGVGLAGFGSMQSTILIGGAAPEMRSRVMGLLSLCIGAGPIGVLLVGALGDSIGSAAAVSLTAGAGIAAVAIAVLRWPALWRGIAGTAGGAGRARGD